MSRLAIIGYALLGIALAFSAGFGAGWVKRGHKAEIDQAIDGWQVFADAVNTATEVGRDVLAIGVQLREQLATTHASESRNRSTVREVLYAHPEFADQRRPAALERVRRDELEAINRAAQADRL